MRCLFRLSYSSSFYGCNEFQNVKETTYCLGTSANLISASFLSMLRRATAVGVSCSDRAWLHSKEDPVGGARRKFLSSSDRASTCWRSKAMEASSLRPDTAASHGNWTTASPVDSLAAPSLVLRALAVNSDWTRLNSANGAEVLICNVMYTSKALGVDWKATWSAIYFLRKRSRGGWQFSGKLIRWWFS